MNYTIIESKKDFNKLLELYKNNELPTSYRFLRSIKNNSYKVAFINYLLNETEKIFCSYHLKYMEYWKYQDQARNELNKILENTVKN